MREILFRGKCQTGEWVCGGFVSRNGKPEIVECDRADDGDFIFTTQVDPTTVGQFTGLKDKNGKMIFEGDVVHVDNYDEGWDSIVEFNGGAFAVDVEGKEYDYTAIGWVEYETEVIGNIHEGGEKCTSAIVE